MKIIDLLNKIANGEKVPKKIKINNIIFEYQGDDYLFKDKNNDNHEYWLFSDGYTDKFEWLDSFLKTEVKILEDEEDKDIPLIPDDELIILKQSKTADMQYAIDFNFRVVEEKINQVVEELNRRNNEEESSNKD